eukprot:COSAG02_NODE_25695_length_651_cov_2.201087_1_plen_27_part_01
MVPTVVLVITAHRMADIPEGSERDTHL